MSITHKTAAQWYILVSPPRLGNNREAYQNTHAALFQWKSMRQSTQQGLEKSWTFTWSLWTSDLHLLKLTHFERTQCHVLMHKPLSKIRIQDESQHDRWLSNTCLCWNSYTFLWYLHLVFTTITDKVLTSKSEWQNNWIADVWIALR